MKSNCDQFIVWIWIYEKKKKRYQRKLNLNVSKWWILLKIPCLRKTWRIKRQKGLYLHGNGEVVLCFWGEENVDSFLWKRLVPSWGSSHFNDVKLAGKWKRKLGAKEINPGCLGFCKASHILLLLQLDAIIFWCKNVRESSDCRATLLFLRLVPEPRNRTEWTLQHCPPSWTEQSLQHGLQ